MRATRERPVPPQRGKSRAQIRRPTWPSYARGLTVPSDLVLDATADALAQDRERSSVVYSARVLAELGETSGNCFRASAHVERLHRS
jgi:hypothetical protein